MNIERIFLVISLIFMVIMYTKMVNMEKKCLENFNNSDIVEHMTDGEINDKIKKKIQEEYNYDLEAIRNLGAISKSLITGKNYHNTDPTDVDGSGTVTIPANVRILGNITVDGNSTVDGNLTVDGNGEIGSAYIGSSKSHGGGFAEFSHKNNGNDSYSIIAAADGQLYLNTKDGKYIGFRHNNEQKIAMYTNNGHFDANGNISAGVDIGANGRLRLDRTYVNNQRLEVLAGQRDFYIKNSYGGDKYLKFYNIQHHDGGAQWDWNKQDRAKTRIVID